MCKAAPTSDLLDRLRATGTSGPGTGGPPTIFSASFRGIRLEDTTGPDPRRIFTQEWVSNPNLELKLYGPGTKGHGLEHQDEPRFKDFAGSLIVNTQADIDWAYIWSGFAEVNWAFRQGPDGLWYLLTDEDAGALLRIEPVQAATATAQ